VLSELLEYIDQAFSAPNGGSARNFISSQHPLQAFSPRYGDRDERLFTFARIARPKHVSHHTDVAAAPGPEHVSPDTDIAAAAEPVTSAAPAAAAYAEPAQIIKLDQLLAFWRHPTRWFCQHVLDVRFPHDDDRSDDAEPFELHNLDKYQLTDQGVRARLVGAADPSDPDSVRATGMLPPGSLGRLAQIKLEIEIERFLAHVREQSGNSSQGIQVRGSDYVLQGELGGLRADALVLWRASKLKTKDQLHAWIHHVAMCAAADQGAELPRSTVILATDQDVLAPSTCPALPHLDLLVDGFRRGNRSPLPFFEHASADPFRPRKSNGDPRSAEEAVRAARRLFEPKTFDDSAKPHDLPDPYIELCFRDEDPLADEQFLYWAEQIYQPAYSWFTARAGTS